MPNRSLSPTVFRLLYVEDNPADVGLVREALDDFHPAVALTVIESGSDALAYLRQQNPHTGVRPPHLVLLDLNLPGVDGEQVLVAIKTDSKLKALPVVVFTSVANARVCKPVYHENANSCISKPGDLDSFLHTVRQTCAYWFSIANVPDLD